MQPRQQPEMPRRVLSVDMRDSYGDLCAVPQLMKILGEQVRHPANWHRRRGYKDGLRVDWVLGFVDEPKVVPLPELA